MKIFYLLLLTKLFFFITISFPQITENQQPIIRVLIISSTKEVEVVFNDEFNSLISGTTYNFSKGDSVSLSVLGKWLNIRFGDESILANTKKLNIIRRDENSILKIKNVPYGVGWWWEGKEDRLYDCEIEIVLNQNNLVDVIAILPLEKYLKGVVPNEIGSDAPFEALKAQVFSARTETMHAIISRKYAGENYDICSDVDCQVYGGINKKNAITDSAVKVTEGLCLAFNDEIIPAYFSSNCGGMSESLEKVWENRSPAVDYYLPQFDSDDSLLYNPKQNPLEWIKSSPNVFCNPEYHSEFPEWSRKNFRWKVDLSKEVLIKNLNQIKPTGNLKKIKILERGYSGRIIKLKFIGKKDSLEISSELSIRKITNPPLKSSNFIIENYPDSDTEIPDTLTILGAGWGHGIGLCQSGAIARAHSGQNYEKILLHYYPKTKIKKIY